MEVVIKKHTTYVDVLATAMVANGDVWDIDACHFKITKQDAINLERGLICMGDFHKKALYYDAEFLTMNQDVDEELKLLKVSDFIMEYEVDEPSVMNLYEIGAVSMQTTILSTDEMVYSEMVPIVPAIEYLLYGDTITVNIESTKGGIYKVDLVTGEVIGEGDASGDRLPRPVPVVPYGDSQYVASGYLMSIYLEWVNLTGGISSSGRVRLCPSCDSAENVVMKAPFSIKGESEVVWVECTACGNIGPASLKGEEDAIRLWNTVAACH
jgi:DNA-directed RNA polymerase subunit M/transcription elongation factor TFIIS